MGRFFEILQDMNVPDRWYLTDPTDQQGHDVGGLLWSGKSLDFTGPIKVQFNEFAKRGRPIDYCELDAIGGAVPIVHVRVAMLFQELALSDVQLVRAEIDGTPDQFYVLNVVRVCDCIDESKSRYAVRYTSADAALFADRIGEFKDVRGPRIDKAKVGDAKVFRTWGWPGSLIVAEEIKQGLERIRVVGVRFEEV